MALENTTASYTIKITKDGSGATEAAAEFERLNSTARTASSGANEVSESLRTVRESAMLTHESTRTLTESIALLGGGKFPELAAAAITASEGMKVARSAALAFKVSLSEVLFPLAAIAAVIGGAAAAWHIYSTAGEEVTKQFDEMVETLDKVPALMEKVQTAAKAGLVSGAAQSDFADKLNPNSKWYVDQDGNLTKSPTRQVQIPDWSNLPNGGMYQSGSHTGTENNPEATEEQRLKSVKDAISQIPEEQAKARGILDEMVQKSEDQILQGIEKEKQATREKFAAEREEMINTAQQAGQLAGNGLQKGLANTYTAEQQDLDNIDKKAAAEQQKKDVEAYNAELNQEIAENEEIVQQVDEYITAQKAAAEAQKQRAEETKQLGDLENKITEENLTGEAKRKQVIEDSTNAQIAQFTKLAQELGLTQSQIDTWTAKIKSGADVMNQKVDEGKLHLMSIQNMEDQAANSFASGFSKAFVEFADGTKTAAQAFGQFAAQFMEQIAEMIIQQQILKAISFFDGGGTAGSDTGSASGDAWGGIHFAASGIQSVSSPTYFPRFNVVAGEAGREMLTVLARPSFRSVGGVDSVVGMAGPNRLAISNADDLANRSPGGTIHIQIDHTPETQANIISSSIRGATMEVTRQMKRNSPIAAAVKGLTA